MRKQIPEAMEELEGESSKRWLRSGVQADYGREVGNQAQTALFRPPFQEKQSEGACNGSMRKGNGVDKCAFYAFGPGFG